MSDIEEYEEEDYESDLKKELLAKMRTYKPCPFCGGYVKLTESHGVQGDVDYIIWCGGCSMEYTKARWFNGYDKTKIIEDWNRRVNE